MRHTRSNAWAISKTTAGQKCFIFSEEAILPTILWTLWRAECFLFLNPNWVFGIKIYTYKKKNTKTLFYRIILPLNCERIFSCNVILMWSLVTMTTGNQLYDHYQHYLYIQFHMGRISIDISLSLIRTF